MRASFCKFSYFYWLQQILIYLFLLLFGKTNNVVVAFFCSASTDADVCTDRRGCLHRPTRMLVSTDADVCIDRRGCSHQRMRMLNWQQKNSGGLFLSPPLCTLGAYGIPAVGMFFPCIACGRNAVGMLLFPCSAYDRNVVGSYLFSLPKARRSKPSCP